jgi:mono/diheme cytochrome c family protein
MTSPGLNGPPAQVNRRQPWALLALVAALFVGAAAVSYFGARPRPLPESGPPPAAATPVDPVVRIDLPHQDYPVPSGPYREQFQVNCTVCHSPRLAFTQPPLPEKKWQEVVHKMVAAYGAPLAPDEEGRIVTYLSAVHGQSVP